MRTLAVVLLFALVSASSLPAAPRPGDGGFDSDLILLARAEPEPGGPAAPGAVRRGPGDATPVAWGDCPTTVRVARDGLVLVATRAFVFDRPRAELLELSVGRADAAGTGPAEAEFELVPVAPPASRDLTRVRRAARPGDPTVTARLLVEGAVRVKVRVDLDGSPFPVLFELVSDPPHCHR